MTQPHEKGPGDSQAKTAVTYSDEHQHTSLTLFKLPKVSLEAVN